MLVSFKGFLVQGIKFLMFGAECLMLSVFAGQLVSCDLVMLDVHLMSIDFQVVIFQNDIMLKDVSLRLRKYREGLLMLRSPNADVVQPTCMFALCLTMVLMHGEIYCEEHRGGADQVVRAFAPEKSKPKVLRGIPALTHVSFFDRICFQKSLDYGFNLRRSSRTRRC